MFSFAENLAQIVIAREASAKPFFCSAALSFIGPLRSFVEAQQRVLAASELAQSGVLNCSQSAEDCCKTRLCQDSTNGQNDHMQGHLAATATHFGSLKLVPGSQDFTLCGIVASNREHIILFGWQKQNVSCLQAFVQASPDWKRSYNCTASARDLVHLRGRSDQGD